MILAVIHLSLAGEQQGRAKASQGLRRTDSSSDGYRGWLLLYGSDGVLLELVFHLLSCQLLSSQLSAQTDDSR